MAPREILKFPDPRLRKVSEPVGEITDAIRALAAEMLEIMYDEPGIGLAAPQVNEPIRLVVMDVDWNNDEAGGGRNPTVLVNPEILQKEGETTWTEGCLSVPDFQAEVSRAAKVKVRALDLDGNEQHYEAEGLRAVCFQHEIDHLNGVLFIDHISRLKRSMYTKRRRKDLLREQEEEEPALPPNFFSDKPL